MRVLLVSQAEWSHAAGMVPVGWGLRAAGHDVLFATQPELARDLASCGLPVTAVGRDHRVGELLHRVPRHRRDQDLANHCLDPEVTWETRTWTEGYIVQWWLALVNEPMLPGLVDLCRQWRPDLVVWETTTFAGAVAARSIGARHIRFTWSIDLLGTMRCQFIRDRDRQPAEDRQDPLAEWLTRCAERFGCGYDEELTRGQATITQVPASLRPYDPTDTLYLPMRYVPYNGSHLVPSWVLAEAERPRVSVCLGSSAITRFGHYACSARDLLAGLGELDVEVVATLAASEHDSLGALPDNVRLETFVPLDALLTTCVATVNHGGPGTLMTAAAHGVPQLVVPAEFDALQARGRDRRGRGRAQPRRPGGDARDREGLRGSPDRRAVIFRGRRLRDEVRAMPDPYTLGDALTTRCGLPSAATKTLLEVP